MPQGSVRGLCHRKIKDSLADMFPIRVKTFSQEPAARKNDAPGFNGTFCGFLSYIKRKVSIRSVVYVQNLLL